MTFNSLFTGSSSLSAFPRGVQCTDPLGKIFLTLQEEKYSSALRGSNVPRVLREKERRFLVSLRIAQQEKAAQLGFWWADGPFYVNTRFSLAFSVTVIATLPAFLVFQGRFFNFEILDMYEVGISKFKSMAEISKTAKPTLGKKNGQSVSAWFRVGPQLACYFIFYEIPS